MNIYESKKTVLDSKDFWSMKCFLKRNYGQHIEQRRKYEEEGDDKQSSSETKLTSFSSIDDFLESI